MSGEKTLYRVVEACGFDLNGRQYVLKRGDLIDEDHPGWARLKDSPLVQPVEAADTAKVPARATAVKAVEQATAVPGQKRTRTQPEINRG